MSAKKDLAAAFREHEQQDNRRHEENVARFDDIGKALAYVQGQVTVILVVLAIVAGLISYGMVKTGVL